MRARFGKKGAKTCYIPDAQNIVKASKFESLLTFGKRSEDNPMMTCLGIGRVVKVEKGKDMDMVFLNFGRPYSRKIIVVSNHARRQLVGLKVGQLTWFYGYYKLYNSKDGKTAIKTVFFAVGFQPWYVPKAVDIVDYDNDDFNELTQEQEVDMLNFLDSITEEN